MGKAHLGDYNDRFPASPTVSTCVARSIGPVHRVVETALQGADPMLIDICAGINDKCQPHRDSTLEEINAAKKHDLTAPQ